MDLLKPTPCPICGKKVFVIHDKIPDGDFGWSSGCPSMCNYDGVHGVTPDSSPEDIPKIMYAPSKHDAIKQWNCWAENWKSREKGGENNCQQSD